MGQSRHVVGYLRDFLFRDEQARQPVRALSGGERNRLLLAKILAQPSNLLILDEPTNDLDIETLDLLEEMLADYAGTLLLVSHDRDFLDRLVTSTIVFEGGGRVREYAGGYSDWLQPSGRAGSPKEPAATVAASATARGGRAASMPNCSASSTACRSGWRRSRAQIVEVEQRLADAAFYARDPTRLRARHRQLERLRHELAATGGALARAGERSGNSGDRRPVKPAAADARPHCACQCNRLREICAWRYSTRSASRITARLSSFGMARRVHRNWAYAASRETGTPRGLRPRPETAQRPEVAVNRNR